VIFVGIDDTDAAGSPGTNQLARALARRTTGWCRCVLILRHQLLRDRRVPCTTKNGSASLVLAPREPVAIDVLIDELRVEMRERFVGGSDPGLCVGAIIPHEITVFGRRCQQELVEQAEARKLAAQHGLYLEGLGGTEGGTIGALAAVGLAASENDGRVVQIGDWPDDLAGRQEIAVLNRRGVEVRYGETDRPVECGWVDVGKHLRPNFRQGRIVLYVRPTAGAHEALAQAVRLD
jgi:hypothetical protein